jgi:hypothetical protein
MTWYACCRSWRIHLADPKTRASPIAIIHAATRYLKPDGAPGRSRYTDVWARRDDRWRCVSAT